MFIRPQSILLIHSAAGGVGSFLTQLAKHKGAILLGITSSSSKMAYLLDNYVDYPINYRKKDIGREVSRITQGQGVDMVFDAVGGSNFKRSIGLLAYGGCVIAYGAASLTGKNRSCTNCQATLPSAIITPSRSCVNPFLFKVWICFRFR